jgi:hypothetical protein
VHWKQTERTYPAEFDLVAVKIQGAEVERLKSAEPEKITPQFPASKMLQANGQFVGSGFAKVVSASRLIS